MTLSFSALQGCFNRHAHFVCQLISLHCLLFYLQIFWQWLECILSHAPVTFSSPLCAVLKPGSVVPPCFVTGRDHIYPPPGFALLHSPFQNVEQTGEGEGRKGVCSNEIYNSMRSPQHRGSNSLDRYGVVPRPPGMSFGFLAGALSPSLRVRIYRIWSGGGQELARCCVG